MANKQTPVEAIAEPSPALENPAIARCANAWEDAYGTEMEETDSDYRAKQKAGEAYRAAMPPLTSRGNCRDFIACVAHGILLGAIGDKNSGKLLYAAQVALGAVGAEEKSRELAAYAVYASLSASETACVKKFLPQPSKIA